MQEQDENAGTGEDFENIQGKKTISSCKVGPGRGQTPLLMGEAICHFDFSRPLGIESMAGVFTHA